MMKIYLALVLGLFLTAQVSLAGICSNIMLNDSQKAQIKLSQIRTQELLALQKTEKLIETVVFRHPERQDIINVQGVPRNVKVFEHQGTVVFRHYTEKSLDLILSSKSLISGVRPFIDPDELKKLNYIDLKGPMSTFPDFDPKRLRMEIKRSDDWVEYTLHPSVPVLLCKEGNCLIPTASSSLPDWIIREYQKYKATGEISRTNISLKPTFEKLDREGLPIAGEIPIQIVRYQKNGLVTEVERKEDFDLSKHIEEFNAIITAPIFSADALMDFLSQKQLFSELFESHSGTGEDLTIRDHNHSVYRLLNEQFPHYIGLELIAKLKNIQGIDLVRVLKILPALHDIGKPLAIANGTKAKQHQYTIPLLVDSMEKLNFSKNEIELAKNLVDNNIFYDLLTLKSTATQADELLSEISSSLSMDEKDYFILQSFYYAIDAGSYSNLRGKIFKDDGGKLIINHPAYRELENKLAIPMLPKRS